MCGINLYSVVPIREKASHLSQMVSQLLFGETYEVTGQSGEWLSVKCAHDNYQGYLAANQHTALQELGLQHKINTQLFTMISRDGHHFPVSLGSLVPVSDWEIGGKRYVLLDPLPDKPVGDMLSVLLHYSHWLEHTPYLWGGRSPLGMDCSGLVQLIFRLLGTELPRDAWMQAGEGSSVNLVQEALPGDLAFFDNEAGKITHVGILLDAHRILHASGCVRIDRFDQEGIFDAESKRYTHKLRLIRRIS